MKIRKAIKVTVTGTVFVLPGTVLAALPQTNNFTYDAFDNITAVTDPGFTCSATAGGDAGFLQRQCTDGSNTFIQTIVVEQSTEGVFTDSNYVLVGQPNAGILDESHHEDSPLNPKFIYWVDIIGDWFRANDFGGSLPTNQLGNTVAINIAQGVTDTSGANETMTSTFGLTEDAFANQTIDINQGLTNTTPGEEFSQSFDHYELNAAQSGQTSNGVTFAAGDYLATSLINQDVTGVGIFSLQDFADENTGGGTGVDSLVSAGPHYTITYSDSTAVFP